MKGALWTLGFVLAIVVLPAATAVTVVVTPVVAPSYTFLQSGPTHPTSHSTNWAGYAVTGTRGSVSFVQGSWVQPGAVSCSSASRWSSFWVGIDGFNSGTVEQTGTELDCSGGSAVLSAWYEFFPAFPVTISSVPITAGDHIEASVTYVNATVGFTVFLKDVTTGHSYTHSHKVASAHRSSAEWIAEAPSSASVLPLTDFGVAKFGTHATGIANTNEATISGTTGAIGSFASASIQRINMASGATTKAATSALTPDGTSFNVTWKHA
ncbi:MAG: G1 family endopeptidase [Thermoplasmata archaeon]|nr:G1 family endopeptidase [Thermoplasmata archaeon]MCI4356313.1 G1 family endopeptidase [Thermoplasmata archaeon]